MEENKIIIDLQVNNTQQVQNFNTQITNVTQNVTKVNTQIKGLEGSLKKNKKSFESSSKSILDMVKSIKFLGTDIGTSIKNFKAAQADIAKLTRVLGSSSKGMTVAQKATKAFNIALKSNPIGFIVGLLGKLGQMFFKTEKGAKLLQIGTIFINKAFEGLMGFIQPLIDNIGRIFTEPKKALADFGKMLINNVINRFKSISVFGKGIAKIFKGDFKEGFKDLGNAAIQLTTGVEDGIDKIAAFGEEIKETATNAIEATDKLNKLNNALKSLTKAEKDFALEKAKSNNEVARLQRIIDDESKSFDERIKASKQQQAELLRINQKEVDFANQRIASLIAIKAQEGKLTDEQEDELRATNVKLEELNGQKAQIQADGLQVRKDLNNQEVEIEKEKKAQLDEFLNEERETELNDDLSNEQAQLDARKALFDTQLKLYEGDAKAQKAIETQLQKELKDIREKFSSERANDEKQKLQDFLDEKREIEINEDASNRQDELDKLQAVFKDKLALYKGDADAQVALQKQLKAEIAIVNAEFDEKEAELDAEKAEARKKAAIELAQQSYDAIFEFEKTQREKELADLNKQKEAELALAGDNEKAKERIQKKFAAEEKKIKTEQAKADKRKALFDIAINTAVGVSKALATGNPILAAIVAVQGALQATLVAAKPIPKFRRGGLLQGPSHEAGGIPFNIDGRGGFEAEGGEILLTKGVAQNPFLRARASELNVAAGGVPIPGAIGSKFALGGLLPPQVLIPQSFRNNQNSTGIDVESFTSSLANKINSREVVLPVEHLHSVSTTVRLQESENSF